MNYASGCNYVFAYEAQAFPFEEDVFLFLVSTTKAKSVVFGTSAKFRNHGGDNRQVPAWWGCALAFVLVSGRVE